MVDSLKSKTLHALSWSFLESVGVQGVRFIIGIILARLLFPEQFGLIGMLMIFLAVAQSLFPSERIAIRLVHYIMTLACNHGYGPEEMERIREFFCKARKS